MAYKEVQRVDISEVVRRWQAGGSRRRIAAGTGLSRETVGKYIALAEGMGVSREGPTPTEEQLGRLAAISRPGPQHGAVPTEDRLAPWADQIYHWLTGGRLQLTRVQELLAQRGCPVHRGHGASPPVRSATSAAHRVPSHAGPSPRAAEVSALLRRPRGEVRSRATRQVDTVCEATPPTLLWIAAQALATGRKPPTGVS